MEDFAKEIDNINDTSLKILNIVKEMKRLMINRALSEGWTLDEIEAKLKETDAQILR